MQVGVVIPSYRVKKHILQILEEIPELVTKVYVVDDACPDNSGDFVAENCNDSRVEVLKNPENLGVGGAVIAGYQAAVNDGIDIIVKVDGDGQMNPSLIPAFVAPIISGEADYTKGNRFFDLETLKAMPKVRLFGNAVLSLMCKLSSGYWNLSDPTNGYTAIHASVVRHLPLNKISKRYFFETDMLFRLNTLRAVAVDIPMMAKYEDEVSHLKITQIIGEFLAKHVRNFTKRIFYNYYLRDMSVASIELPVGVLFISFGVVYGGLNWISSVSEGVPTSAGTVMLSALPVIAGIQFILNFINFDVATVPTRSIHSSIWRKSVEKSEENR
ncbi:MAG: glycosyltransferase family 2 protein [Lentilitoribacter sp.]